MSLANWNIHRKDKPMHFVLIQGCIYLHIPYVCQNVCIDVSEYVFSKTLKASLMGELWQL